MARSKNGDSSKKARQSRPALTPEGRENQLISLAVDLAEERLRNGTATSQEIVHFLRLGSTNAKLEKERLRMENDLMQAKIDAINKSSRIEELYSEAIDAMKRYSGSGYTSEEDED